MTEALFTMSPQRTAAMKGALTRLGAPDRRITSLDFLSASEIASLRNFADIQDYRLATPVSIRAAGSARISRSVSRPRGRACSTIWQASLKTRLRQRPPP